MKSKAISFQLGFKNPKLNFENQNELLRSAQKLHDVL
jgi:hypothetical protein